MDDDLTEQDMQTAINELIRGQLNLRADEVINPKSNLELDYEADSLDALCIVMNIETEFNIEIIDEDYVNVKTVQDIYDLVAAKLKLKSTHV